MIQKGEGEMEAQKYYHPRFEDEVVFGHRLKPGEIPKKDDVYDAPDGWRRVPEEAFKAPIRPDSAMMIVRPAREVFES